VLDCSKYKKLCKIFIFTSVDSNKFEIIKGSCKDYHGRKYETQIIPCSLAQEYLDKKYPKEKREKITRLNIDEKGLEEDLDLSDSVNLEVLYCYNNHLTNLNLNNCQKLKKVSCFNNQLTTLNLSNCEQLEELDCSNNYLTQLPHIPNPEKITSLAISDNSLSSQDLSVFSQFKNLKCLKIGN